MAIQSEMQKYQKMMQNQYPKQNLFAIRSTLNQLASTSRQQAVTKGTADFVKRNQYINRSIRFQKVVGPNNEDSMASMFGQMAKMYGKPAGQLAVQEKGGIIKPKTGKTLRIGTMASRKGKDYRQPIRKKIAQSKFLTPKKFYANAKNTPHTERGRAIGMIAWAKRKKSGKPMGLSISEQRDKRNTLIKFRSPQKKRYGVFKVGGSKNKTTVNMVFNLEKKSQSISATHWMEKSYKGPVSKRDNIYKFNMENEITMLKRKNGF